MNRKDLIEKIFKIEGHPEHMAAFLVAEEEDRDIANADSIGQGQGPLPSFEDHLAEEPSLSECDAIRQRIYGFLAD